MASAGENPYHQGPASNAGYSYGQANAPSLEPIELQQQHPNAFLNRISQLNREVESLDGAIDHIGKLHQRILASPDGQAKDQLEQYTAQTQSKTSAIRDGIKSLERDYASSTDQNRKNVHGPLQALKSNFRRRLENFQRSEQKYRNQYQEQIKRQLRIVQPNATDSEIKNMVDNWGGEDVFKSALQDSRKDQAQSVLGNARARHNELQNIEKTIAELAVLFQDLATVVEQQDPVVQAAERNAEETNQNIEAGNVQVKKATVSARRARKLKWWCLFIVVLIVIAVALGVGLGICLTGNKCKS